MVYMSTGHTSPPADTSAREGVREGLPARAPDEIRTRDFHLGKVTCNHYTTSALNIV
jgi:hypothetical protein